MSSAQILRYLILALWATGVVGAVLDFSLESRLPDPLRDYLTAQWERDLNLREGVGLIAGLAALWFMVRGSIQLYRLRAEGRRPFLLGLVISILMMPLLGPVIYNAWSPLFYEASVALGGVIVGWLYLSDVQLQLEGATPAEAQLNRPPPIG